MRLTLFYPIILAADGTIMDRMHRVTKAVIAGRPWMRCNFSRDPAPDHVGCRPDELPC
jgi:hypothetical protein